jgi:hypothetical protein
MLLFINSRLIGFGSVIRRTQNAGRWFVRASGSFVTASLT